MLKRCLYVFVTVYDIFATVKPFFDDFGDPMK